MYTSIVKNMKYRQRVRIQVTSAFCIFVFFFYWTLAGNRSIPIYWINVNYRHDRSDFMKNQFQNIVGITPIRVNAFTSTQIEQMSHKIVTNGFHIKKSDKETPTYSYHLERTYTFKEIACLFSHLKVFEQMSLSSEKWAVVSEDDVIIPSDFRSKLEAIMQNAPKNWEILQLYTNNMLQAEHNMHLDIDWIHWMPHHWGTMLYVIKKSTAERILHSIKAKNKYTFPYNNVAVADEFIYWKANTYTYTKFIIDHKDLYSEIQPNDVVIEDKMDVIINKISTIVRPQIKSTLYVITLMTVDNIYQVEENLNQLKMEIDYMKSLHEIPPVWDVIIIKRADIQIQINVPNYVSIKVHHESTLFSKWKYISRYIENMKFYDNVLIKDFDQNLIGFSWKTFMAKKGSAVIASPIREALEESMPRHYLFKKKRQWFQVNDANWWRKKSRNSFTNINTIQRVFLEQYFALFDGRFAHWFFSKMEFDDVLDYGPDYLWCGAANDWSYSRTPCVVIPIVSKHDDTRTLPPVYIKKPGFEHIQSYIQNNPELNKWNKYSQQWRNRWGGY